MLYEAGYNSDTKTEYQLTVCQEKLAQPLGTLIQLTQYSLKKVKNKAFTSEYGDHKPSHGAEGGESRCKDSVDSCEETQGNPGKQTLDFTDMRGIRRFDCT